MVCANKKMLKTNPARGSFHIIARLRRLGGCVGSLPQVRARVSLVILGVRQNSPFAPNKKLYDNFPEGCYI